MSDPIEPNVVDVVTRPASNVAEGHPRSLVEQPIQGHAVVGQALSAAAMTEVRLAMQMAIEYPRNEDDARGKIMKACARYSFADKAMYRYRRGSTPIQGASIQLATEMGKYWRNMRWGHYNLADDAGKRTIRCWAWDLENNTKAELDIVFEKKVQRKLGQGGKAVWVPTDDERELLEVSNRNGSKGVRNCILSLLPWDLREDALKAVADTLDKAIKEDPEKFRKGLVASFARIGVSGAELTAYIGVPLEQVRDEERMALLRGVFNRLRDGEATWQDVLAEKAEQEGLSGRTPTTAVGLRDKIEAKARAAEAEARKGVKSKATGTGNEGGSSDAARDG